MTDDRRHYDPYASNELNLDMSAKHPVPTLPPQQYVQQHLPMLQASQGKQLSVPVSWVAIILLACAVVYLFLNPQVVVIDKDKDGQDIVTPDDKEEPILDDDRPDLDNILGDGHVLFIYEGTAPTFEEEKMLIVADDFVEKYGMEGKRVWDFNQRSAREPLAKAREAGITGSFVAIAKDKAVTKVVPWPKSIADLETALKQ